MNRDEFMSFFRAIDFHDHIKPEDVIEIFLNVLWGSSEISQDLMDKLVENYDVGEGLSITVKKLTDDSEPKNKYVVRVKTTDIREMYIDAISETEALKAWPERLRNGEMNIVDCSDDEFLSIEKVSNE